MDRWAALDDAGARARAAAGLPAETLRRLEDLRTTHQILAIQRVPPLLEPECDAGPFRLYIWLMQDSGLCSHRAARQSRTSSAQGLVAGWCVKGTQSIQSMWSVCHEHGRMHSWSHALGGGMQQQSALL